MQRVGRHSLWLGLSQAVELGLQVLLPILLVRHLVPTDFGEYRRAWLIAGTAASILPFAVPDVLALLLPSRPASDQAAHVHVAFAVLLVLGVAAGLATVLALELSGWSMQGAALACACFVGFWVPGVLLDYLPTADERGDWQAKACVVLAALRAAVSAWAVFAWGHLEPLLWALGAVAALRLGVVAFYGQRHHRWMQAKPSAEHWRRHWALAAPLGTTGLLFTLRRQADQWIAMIVLGPVQFAAFSLGSVASPLVLLVRRAQSAPLLPALARLNAEGNRTAVLNANHRANFAVACIAWPVLSFLVCFGEPLYDMVYTPRFREAVPVMRLLAISWAMQAVELNSLVQLSGLMPRVARLNIGLLALSLVGTALGALAFGLAGLAAGGVVAAAVERLVVTKMISRAWCVPPGVVQPWGRLAAVGALCIALGGIGRLAFEALPAGLAPWLGILLVTPVMLGPYLFVLWRMGWWNRQLIATSASES